MFWIQNNTWTSMQLECFFWFVTEFESLTYLNFTVINGIFLFQHATSITFSWLTNTLKEKLKCIHTFSMSKKYLERNIKIESMQKKKLRIVTTMFSLFFNFQMKKKIPLLTKSKQQRWAYVLQRGIVPTICNKQRSILNPQSKIWLSFSFNKVESKKKNQLKQIFRKHNNRKRFTNLYDYWISV